jgi:hypothetical protein
MPFILKRAKIVVVWRGSGRDFNPNEIPYLLRDRISRWPSTIAKARVGQKNNLFSIGG